MIEFANALLKLVDVRLIVFVQPAAVVVEIEGFVHVDHGLNNSLVGSLHNTRQVNDAGDDEAHAQSVDPVDSEEDEGAVAGLPLVDFPLKLDVQGANNSAEDTETHE